MKFFDFTHAYQPFEPPQFLPTWVLSNLKEIFLPVSRAMLKGIIKRHVQVQGWTIDAWLKSPEPIKSKALEFLENLQEASQKKFIEIGFSAYSHPILPFLSESVIKRQIKQDYQIVKKYLGEPSWFWFPEGASDLRSLQILFEQFPNISAIITDSSISQQNSSFFAKTKEGNKLIICNSILKDIFMNAVEYKIKPSYFPKEINWKSAQNIVFNKDALIEIAKFYSNNGSIILTRDLENNAAGLIEFQEGLKEIKSMLEAKNIMEFTLLDIFKEENTVKEDVIKPSCWEPASTPKNPYPYWNLPSWLNFINTFNEIYKDDFDKVTLIILCSDIPWHILAKKEFKTRFPGHSKEFTKKVILPIVRKIGNKNLIKAAQDLMSDLEKYD